MTVCSFKSN